MSVNHTDDLTKLKLCLLCLVVGFLVVGLLILPFLLWLNLTPIYQQESILDVKDFFELKNQAIKSVITSIQIYATVFGGIAILFNVYYGAKRAKAMENNAIATTQNAIAATKNAEVAEQGQITERFTKAIEQLSSDNISIRLGGIYALERIAKDSERDHWTIMEVLSALVRENAPVKDDLEEKKAEGEQQLQKLCTDIQAALTVIGSRNPDLDQGVIDLSNTDIRGANLIEAKLPKANLSGAKLQGAMLCKADLQRANLSEAILEGANFSEANLKESIIRRAIVRHTTLHKAKLQKADLRFAKLQGAFLDKADLKEAYLSSAILQGTYLNKSNLQGSNLIGTQLDDANLQEADFSQANLRGTRLFRADLRGANNLQQQQIEKAFGDSKTLLPANVEKPAHWM